MAVIVVVEKCTSAAHGFGEQFFTGGAVGVDEVNARRFGDFGEGDGGWRVDVRRGLGRRGLRGGSGAYPDTEDYECADEKKCEEPPAAGGRDSR